MPQHNKTKIQFVSFNELNKIIQSPVVVAITDRQIFNNYPEVFQNVATQLIILPQSENYKTGDNFIFLCNELACQMADKNTHLLGIGGGSITDLTGFVASVYMRGVEVSFVPTTLLALVDAAIGGKNALNVGNIKNLIGSVYLPQNVYINKDFMRSLSQEEWLSGLAEVIKMGLLFDKILLADTHKILAELHYSFNTFIKQPNWLSGLLDKSILQSIEHKANIVAKDIFSENERNLLNFGHTVGHMLELQYKLPHGWAVVLGMLLETTIAVEMQLTSLNVLIEIKNIVATYYIPKLDKFNLDLNAINIADLATNVNFDKKIGGNRIKFPVILEIGKSKLFDITISDFIHYLTSYSLL